MDLVLRGRGVEIGEQLRRSAAARVEKLGRADPSAVRLEIEVANERGARPGGEVRLDGTLSAPGRVLRAHASGHEAEVALDLLFARLERQARDRHDRRSSRSARGSDGLRSARKRRGEGEPS